jgi:hypothetical protein
MSKLTYAQQLAHPNWQRRRLHMLETAGWACTVCGSATETLHVHHRQYFKGRMAWEYTDVELQVICAACHKTAHALDDDLKALLVHLPPAEVFALLAGFYAGAAPYDLVMKGATLDVHVLGAGMFAADVRHLSTEQKNAISDLIESFGGGE